MSEDKDTLPSVDAPVRIKTGEKLSIREPFYPILKIEELPFGKDSPDLRDRLPHEVSKYLGDRRRVVNVKEHKVTFPFQHLSPEEVVKRAAKVRHASEIGYRGPTTSSISLVEGEKSRYEMPHGRDLEHAGCDLAYMGRRQLAKTAALYLAARQGIYDEVYVPGRPFRQEELGSIMLIELGKNDAIAQKFVERLGWGPHLYYGSADAPVNYVNMLAMLEASEPGFLKNNFYNSLEIGHPEQQLSVAFDRSLHWSVKNADRHQGLIAYKNPIDGGGIRNQGWRDSDTAMVHKDGQWASDRVGIAPIEIQGFLFDMYLKSAAIKKTVYRDYKLADELLERAWELQKLVLNKGFVTRNDEGFFASGFDWDEKGNLRPLEVATSAMGRLLTSDIFKNSEPETEEKLEMTITKLFSPEMLTRWGFRTLASDEAAFVPFLYHSGPVWLHDSNEVARGLANYQYYGLDRVAGALTTHQQKTTGVYYEHISGYDGETPHVPNRDTYVYDEGHDVVYLFEQAPPPGQTWAATSEWAKQERYISNSFIHATDPKKFDLEKQVWSTLEPHIQSVVALYEPQLALALSK